MRPIAIFAALLVTCASAAPASAEALTGKWKMRSAGAAPWHTGAAPPTPLDGAELTLKPDDISGNRIMSCEKGRQEQLNLPASHLFEGNLATEAMRQAARKLGLDKDGKGTPTIRFVCNNASFDLHMAGPREFIIVIDNVVYRAQKQN